jgi:transposase InsO family protein
MLNDKVLPFFEQHPLSLLGILTDRGTEYCGKTEHHDFRLYLTIEGIEHSKTNVRSPQSNGICEGFHPTIQEEFYAIAFRKKLYQSIEQMQTELDQ